MLVALSVLAACGDGQTGPAESLEIFPDRVTLTHIGERFAFALQGGGAGGARWSSADTTVFVVDQRGTVIARGSGLAFLAAASAGQSVRALVEVRQEAASYEAFGDGQRAAPGARHCGQCRRTAT